MIFKRISPGVFRHQSVDQYSFSSHIRLEDALVIVENMIEYAHEFDIPVQVGHRQDEERREGLHMLLTFPFQILHRAS